MKSFERLVNERLSRRGNIKKKVCQANQTQDISWANASLLRRPSRKKSSVHRNPESGTVSDGELEVESGKLSAASSMVGLDSASDVGCVRSASRCSSKLGDAAAGSYPDKRASGAAVPVVTSQVAGWAIGFDRLLSDPAGIHTFAEFLKKEFSYENILFWVACERYKKTSDKEKLKEQAKEIFVKHLSMGALEPVNVDSPARQLAQDGLDAPTPTIFDPAQIQIYNLMKFDCYSRFLKSPLYKECLAKDLACLPLPYSGDASLDTSISSDYNKNKGKKVEEGMDDKKRKSLLPWVRTKSWIRESRLGDRTSDLRRSARRKDKDKDSDAASCHSDTTGSRSSLAGNELALIQRQTTSRESLASSDPETIQAEGCQLCRVVLPDHSTTIMQTRPRETILMLVQRLLVRRGLTFTAVDVFHTNSDKQLDVYLESTTLGGKEVRVEPRALFRIELPNNKLLGIKARPSKPVGEVLRPVLQKNGFRLDQMNVRVGGRELDLATLISTIDDKQLVVTSRGEQEVLTVSVEQSSNVRSKSRLDEITSKVFEDLLSGSSQPQAEELHVQDLDKTTIDSNSLDRRIPERRDPLNERSNPAGPPCPDRRITEHSDAPNERSNPIGPPCPEVIIRLCEDTDRPQLARSTSSHPKDDLYDVWRRAQRSRLEDQRGTEINFELPEFLKPNSFPPGRVSEPVGNCRQKTRSVPAAAMSTSNLAVPGARELDSLSRHTYDPCFQNDGVIPSPQEAHDYFAQFDSKFGSDVFPHNNNEDNNNNNLSDYNRGFSDLGNGNRTRPSSHPPPRIPTASLQPRPRLQQSISAPNGVCNKNLWISSSYYNERSLNVQQIPRRQSSLDDTNTPSKLPLPPPPPDNFNTSLHVEEANYPPPACAFSKEDAARASIPVPQANRKYIPLHHASWDALADPPPPLPPKPKKISAAGVRAPPPFGAGRYSMDSSQQRRGVGEPRESLTFVQKARLQLLNQTGRSKKPLYSDKRTVDRCNVSIV